MQWKKFCLPVQRLWKVMHFFWATVGHSKMHQPAIIITWITHNLLCPHFRKWCWRVCTPLLVQPRLNFLFMWLWSCRETISHTCMLKLIERDVGDKEGARTKAAFVTSLLLTGIIRYMKLKFLCGGPVDNTVFRLTPPPPFFLLCFCLC